MAETEVTGITLRLVGYTRAHEVGDPFYDLGACEARSHPPRLE
ncbi:MAG: hypothetical protein QOJ45_1323 [Verrucomicrobiota bacterium]